MTKPNAYERFLAEQLADPEFRAEFERERRDIETIDALVNAADDCGLTKAELARQIRRARSACAGPRP